MLRLSHDAGKTVFSERTGIWNLVVRCQSLRSGNTLNRKRMAGSESTQLACLALFKHLYGKQGLYDFIYRSVIQSAHDD